MEDKKPYEQIDGCFSGLPLPDEDGAWADMKKKLDEADDGRVVVLPVLFQGCGGWALLLTGMLAAGLWFYVRQSGGGKESVGAAHLGYPKEQVSIPNNTVEQAAGTTQQELKIDPNPSAARAQSQKTKKEGASDLVRTLEYTSVPSKTEAATASKRRAADKENLPVEATEKKITDGRNVPATPDEKLVEDAVVYNGTPVGPPLNSSGPSVDSVSAATDTTALLPANPAADSVQNTPAPKKTFRKKHYVGVGLALQQQAPLAGQQWTPYNYRGRRGSLADYLPSVYLRLYREGRWFLHTEFKYGAPQYTKEFVYSKQEQTDTMGTVRSSTSYRLKKTYYHQWPLSFNWYLHPRWSVGAGLVFNRFYGAVSEREVRLRMGATQDSLVSKTLVQDRGDSLFRTTDLQWLLETQYRWRRWSVGARYAQGLQPFIEYVDD
jgi:hypothetical protein